MKRLLQVLAGLAISAVALWLTLRGKDLGAIWAAMRTADYRYLAPYVSILLAIHLVRTVRWGLLLEPVAKVPFARLNAVAAVGFMALVLLPFRLGEFARPYLIADRPRLRVSAALSSVVAERVADGVFMGLVLLVALGSVPDAAPGVRLLRLGGALVAGAFVAILAFLALAYRNRAVAVRLTTRLAGLLSPRLGARIAGMMDAFLHGLRLVPGPGALAKFALLTAAFWALNALGMEILARGFGFDLDFVQSVAVLGVLVVGVMIPAGPGMVGTFQGAVVLGLALFAGDEAVHTRGVAYANVLWAAQIGQQAALGAIFLFSGHIRPSQLLAAPEEVSGELREEEAGQVAANDGARAGTARGRS